MPPVLNSLSNFGFGYLLYSNIVVGSYIVTYLHTYIHFQEKISHFLGKKSVSRYCSNTIMSLDLPQKVNGIDGFDVPELISFYYMCILCTSTQST